jgi:hypothetical protein
MQPMRQVSIVGGPVARARAQWLEATPDKILLRAGSKELATSYGLQAASGTDCPRRGAHYYCAIIARGMEARRAETRPGSGVLEARLATARSGAAGRAQISVPRNVPNQFLDGPKDAQGLAD